ncbi:MAG: acetyl-CoA carboxylase biotin carboxyl carrier protein [Bacteroidota bacterium]
MELKEIQELLKLVNRTNLTEVEIERGDFKIKMRRKSPESNVIYTTQQAVAAAPVAAAPVAAAPAPEPKAPKAKKEAPKAEPAEEKSDLIEFKCPMIGTFYRASGPDVDPFVKVGDQIEKGQVVCIVEAMKLFNEIESEISGKVVKIMVENAQPVEYDQVLFLIDPNG